MNPNRKIPLPARLVGLLLVLGLALAWSVQRRSHPRQSQNPAAGAAYDPQGAGAPHPPRAPATLTDLATGPAGVLPDGARPLRSIPAGLPAYPGATSLMSFQRHADGWTEQAASWSIPGADAAAVDRFYEHAAIAAGFAPAGDPHGSTKLMKRGEQVLLIRVSDHTAGRPGARLTLIFRYTETPGAAANSAVAN